MSVSSAESAMDDSSFQESKRLKTEYWRLISKQISDKEHYDRLFGKLTRRMQVLEDNWRKADDEVVLLDGLVQHIRITLMTHLNTIRGCGSLFELLQVWGCCAKNIWFKPYSIIAYLGLSHCRSCYSSFFRRS